VRTDAYFMCSCLYFLTVFCLACLNVFFCENSIKSTVDQLCIVAELVAIF
jgi:hypothetical protein